MTGSHWSALGYIAANEPGSNTGVSMTRGGQRIARADHERRLFLEPYVETFRREARAHKAKMKLAKYRAEGGRDDGVLREA